MNTATPFLAVAIAFAAVDIAPSQEALPQSDPPFKGKIGRTYEDSTPDYPQPVKAAAGSPNVLIVLLDELHIAHRLHRAVGGRRRQRHRGTLVASDDCRHRRRQRRLQHARRRARQGRPGRDVRRRSPLHGVRTDQ